MEQKQNEVKSAFTLGQLLPLRIHSYVTNLLIHRRNNDLRARFDVLDAWSMDVDFYASDVERTELENNLNIVLKQIQNTYTQSIDHTALRSVERLLHRISDRAGLKASNVEAQEVFDASSVAEEIASLRSELRDA